MWASFIRFVVQGQDVNTGFSGYRRQGGRGLDRANMEYIRGFLVYAAITYRDMNPYLKGLHLNLDSWRPFRDKKG